MTDKTTLTDKITLIVASKPNPNEQEAMQQYVAGVMPLFAELGGQVIKRSLSTDTYLGLEFFTFLLIMDFPSKQMLLNMFESPAYTALLPLRDKGFSQIDISFATDLP